MARYLLCVGINAYPNAPLRGCVNDAMNWMSLLGENGYAGSMLLDESATKQNIMEELDGIVHRARFGDRIMFTYSGHGTWMPDMSGDEPDGRDEALCPIDYDAWGNGANLIVDDELEKLFSLRRFGVRVTIVSDSCHSGSVSRLVGPHMVLVRNSANSMAWWERRPRFIPPGTFLEDDALQRARTVDRRESATMPRNSTGTVLLSGCDDEEYSYDAFIDGVPQGAFSATAIKAYRALEEERGLVTYSQWHRRVRTMLPDNNFPQSPQMYASLWQRRWSL